MGKPTKRTRDEDDADDRDDDRPKKKTKKQAKEGGNTLLFVGIGGVAVVALLCLCGGGGATGYYLGWFGGSGDKKVVAKGGDKDKDKEKDAGAVDQGPPKGTGPLVTDGNFDKAARSGRTLAEVEQILGPGQPLKGAWEEKAKASQVYRGIREARPGADAYQWSNDQSVYFIFFREGIYSAHGGDANPDKGKVKDKVGPGPGTGKGTGPLVTMENFNRAAKDGKTLPQIENILGPGSLLKGADANKAAKYQSYQFLRGANPNGDIYQWSNSQEIYFISFFDGGVFQGKASESAKKK
jgi:hypothetical protein